LKREEAARFSFLMRFLVNHSLRVFAYYRFALAAVVAAALLYSG
jgi:undecaprenyl pyrophosphate phosphatase UppP